MAHDMDFNGADSQDAAFDLIPANTVMKLCLTIRPGGAGPEGWLTRAKPAARSTSTPRPSSSRGPTPGAASTPASAFAERMLAGRARTATPTAAAP